MLSRTEYRDPAVARHPAGAPPLKAGHFAGRTVFLLGGGPSLCAGDVALLRGRPAIAINAAARWADPTEVLFFRDLEWFVRNRQTVDGWAGLAVTTSRCAVAHPRLTRAMIVHGADFPAPGLEQGGRPVIRYGRSSGHLAVSLAVAMFARRVVLLGYDCRFVGGRSHFHDDYAAPIELLYRNDFLPAWRGWGAAAQRVGVEVLNATVGSAITEFPFRPLRELLEGPP